MKRSRLAFAEFISVGRGHGGHVGAFHADRNLRCAATAALGMGDSNGEGGGLIEHYRLCGLVVGVDHFVGGFPVEVERAGGSSRG